VLIEKQHKKKPIEGWEINQCLPIIDNYRKVISGLERLGFLKKGSRTIFAQRAVDRESKTLRTVHGTVRLCTVRNRGTEGNTLVRNDGYNVSPLKQWQQYLAHLEYLFQSYYS
jgi:hypothetical protein